MGLDCYRFCAVFLFIMALLSLLPFFFFNDTATTEIYTLSLHDALPILPRGVLVAAPGHVGPRRLGPRRRRRSEEHTSELQSRLHLVCRLLLEKKKKQAQNITTQTVSNNLL